MKCIFLTRNPDDNFRLLQTKIVLCFLRFFFAATILMVVDQSTVSNWAKRARAIAFYLLIVWIVSDQNAHTNQTNWHQTIEMETTEMRQIRPKLSIFRRCRRRPYSFKWWQNVPLNIRFQFQSFLLFFFNLDWQWDACAWLYCFEKTTKFAHEIICSQPVVAVSLNRPNKRKFKKFKKRDFARI